MMVFTTKRELDPNPNPDDDYVIPLDQEMSMIWSFGQYLPKTKMMKFHTLSQCD